MTKGDIHASSMFEGQVAVAPGKFQEFATVRNYVDLFGTAPAFWGRARLLPKA